MMRIISSSRSRGIGKWAGMGLTFLLLALLCFRFGTPVSSDGHYYFAYLPSLLLDGDLDLSNQYETIGDPYDLGAAAASGRPKNPFQIGAALFWLPFYLLGHLAAMIFGATNAGAGATAFHRWSVALGTVFYGTGTLYLLHRAIREWVSEGAALVGAVGISFGSFLIYYLVAEPSFSHGVSSFVVALFIWKTWRWRLKPETWRFLLLGAILGLAGTVRSQNLLFGVVPVVLLLWKEPTSQGRRLLFLALGAVVGYLPHMIAVSLVYGEFVLIPQGEGFMRWGNPAWGNVLFSTRHGLFAETPVMFFAVLGLVLFVRANRKLASALLLAFLLQWCVNASVSDWWAGAAFGMRRFSGSILILGVGFGFFLDGMGRAFSKRPKSIVRGLVVLPVLFLIWLNVEWIRLYRSGDIPGSSTWSPSEALTHVLTTRIRAIYRITGNPFSFPANWVFAAKHHVSPTRYDKVVGLYFLYDQPFPGSLLRFGDSTYDPFLAEGFSDKATEDGANPRIVADGSARILAPLYEARPLRLRLYAAPCFGTATEGTVQISWNGKPAEPERLEPTWAEYDFFIDSDAVRIGVNEVRIEATGRLDLPMGVRLTQGTDGRPPSLVTELWTFPKEGEPEAFHLRERGLHLLVLDGETGVAAEPPSHFDALGRPWSDLAMKRFVEAAPKGNWVVGCLDEGSGFYLGHHGLKGLRDLGCSTELPALRKHAYAFVGRKGSEPRTAFEVVGEGSVSLELSPDDPLPLMVDWLHFEWTEERTE